MVHDKWVLFYHDLIQGHKCTAGCILINVFQALSTYVEILSKFGIRTDLHGA